MKIARIELPKMGEMKIRFDLYESKNFRVFGDLYSNKRLFLHLDWPNPKMTPSIMKEMINAIAMIKNAAKISEFTHIYCLVTEDLVKFETFWGFFPVDVYITEGQPTYVLMSQGVN